MRNEDYSSTIRRAKSYREVLGLLDEYIYNLSCFNSGETISEDYIFGTHFEILYQDGSQEYIDDSYDGHKIKRQHIIGIVCDGLDVTIVKGKYMSDNYATHVGEY